VIVSPANGVPTPVPAVIIPEVAPTVLTVPTTTTQSLRGVVPSRLLPKILILFPTKYPEPPATTATVSDYKVSNCDIGDIDTRFRYMLLFMYLYTFIVLAMVWNL
jgi:hypothetical protein